MSVSTPRSYAIYSDTDAPHINSAGLFYEGDAGDNTQTGTAGDDGFDFSQGGNDTLHGGGGADEFIMGAAFTPDDKIDGGAGSDTLFLEGDYSELNVLANGTLAGVENIVLAAGFSYSFQLAAGTIAANTVMVIDASALGRSSVVHFNAFNTVDASMVMFGGRGTDTLATPHGFFEFDGNGGDDFLSDEAQGGAFYGGAGDDDVIWDVAWADSGRNQVFDGGRGNDTLEITGHAFTTYTLSFPVLSIAGFETLIFDISTTMSVPDSTLPAKGKTLHIESRGDHIALFADNARGDVDFLSNGAFTSSSILSGRGDDHLSGGGGDDNFGSLNGRDVLLGNDGDDFLEGGRGADALYGGAGHDTFFYSAAGASTGVAFDTVFGFDTQQDFFRLNEEDVDGVAAAVVGGTLDASRFNHDLKIAVGASALPSHFAVLYTPDDGDLAGQTFLIVDLNGTAGYQANQDYVILLSDGQHLDELSTLNFH